MVGRNELPRPAAFGLARPAPQANRLQRRRRTILQAVWEEKKSLLKRKGLLYGQKFDLRRSGQGKYSKHDSLQLYELWVAWRSLVLDGLARNGNDRTVITYNRIRIRRGFLSEQKHYYTDEKNARVEAMGPRTCMILCL